MSVVEEQAKELGVDGAKDGGQERDTMIVSVGMLILIGFLLGGFAQRLVDVGQVSKLACLGRIWGGLIGGGLYSVTALRKLTMRVTVYTKHQLTLQKP